MKRNNAVQTEEVKEVFKMVQELREKNYDGFKKIKSILENKLN